VGATGTLHPLPSESVEIVKRLFAQFAQHRSIDPILPLLDPEIEWTDGIVTHSTLHGHQGFRDALERIASEGYTTEATPEEFEEVKPGAVLARGYTRLVSGTSYTDLPAFWVFEIENGSIVRGGSATRRQDALAMITDGPS
jgi:ketosteroid isomerase-like protein